MLGKNASRYLERESLLQGRLLRCSRFRFSRFRLSVVLRLAPLAGLRLFRPRHATTLFMLKRDVLHSLNASALHADCSAADGLNSAYAEAGNAKIAKPRAAVTPFFRIVFITFPFFSLARSTPRTALWRIRQKGAVTAVTKTPRVRSPGLAGPPGPGAQLPVERMALAASFQ